MSVSRQLLGKLVMWLEFPYLFNEYFNFNCIFQKDFLNSFHPSFCTGYPMTTKTFWHSWSWCRHYITSRLAHSIRKLRLKFNSITLNVIIFFFWQTKCNKFGGAWKDIFLVLQISHERGGMQKSPKMRGNYIPPYSLLSQTHFQKKKKAL